MPASGDPTGKRDARLALVYLRAARRVLGPKGRGAFPDMDIMSGPASFLIAHAVELALGAFLQCSRSRGTKKKENHNLQARLTRLDALGVKLPEPLRVYVRIGTPTHKRGQFRYPRDGEDEEFVDPWWARRRRARP